MSERERQAARRRLMARLRRNRRPVTWLGAALSATGVAVIAFPAAAPFVVGALAGWLLWFAGAAMILVSILAGSERSLFGAILASLVAIASGAFLLFNPLAGAVAVTLMISAVLIVDGAFELALALDLRPLAAWRWVLASSIASAVAGVVVAAGAAGSRAVMAALIGLAFASTGVALLALGRTRRVRPSERASLTRGRRPGLPQARLRRRPS